MASTYLTRTQGTGNRKTWTYSVWIKRSQLGTNQNWGLTQEDAANNNAMPWTFNTSDKIDWYDYNGGISAQLITNRVFRDTSAWYHFVLAVDTTQATSSDRVKLYVNGVQETSFSSATYPSLNYDFNINVNTKLLSLGAYYTSSALYYFNGSMSHIHFIDGTAYDATAFGEFDANGVWKIKTSPSVTYGTNGFFILKDGNSVTDQSGNGNNFTVAGGTLTNTEDSPSNVFATGNPLDFRTGGLKPTFSNGNTVMAGLIGNDASCRGTIGFSSGKFYWENKYTSNSTGQHSWTGIINTEVQLINPDTQAGQSSNSVMFNQKGGEVKKNGSTIATYSGALNDIFGFAFDLDNGTLKMHKNGVYFNSGNSIVTGITADTYLPYFGMNGGSGYSIQNVNFGNGYFGTTPVSSAGTNASGNGIFEYDVPTGFTALSTKGLNL